MAKKKKVPLYTAYSVSILILTLYALAQASYAQTIQPIKIITHKENLYECVDGHIEENKHEWDEITFPKTPFIKKLNEESSNAFKQNLKNLSKEKPDCECPDTDEECTKPYNAEFSNRIIVYGTNIIGVEMSSGGYSGGAHGYESSKLALYEIGTGNKIPFLNLFTPHGQELLFARVKSDLNKEIKSEDFEKCDIAMNDVWSFANKRSSYIPWRINKEHDAKSYDPKDLKGWNIWYGTYAFGCTGRPGYEMYGLPNEVIEKELNPTYFDPKTHYFYE